MPHLSPMSWLFCSVMFFFMIFVFGSIMWWKEMLSFPSFNYSSSSVEVKFWEWE